MTKYISLKNASIIFLLFGLMSHVKWIIKGNIDMSDGAFALHMDELITFNEVNSILNPATVTDLVSNVIDGNDQRYGRILWNATSITSFLPEAFFGEKGLIVSIRLTQSFFLLLAYLILSITFLKRMWIRALAVLILLSLPFTPYYTYVPKPEPIQLLFLSLFLHQLKVHHGEHLKGWIFLGLSYGAKISLFPYSLFIISLYWFYTGQKRGMKALAGFLIGTVLAVPILLKGRFRTYLEATFLNTTHGSDDLSITPISWIDYILHHYFRSPDFLTYLLLTAVILCAALLTIRLMKEKDKIQEMLYAPSFILFICANSFLLPIILKVKRIWGWGFYLHTGTVLLIIWLLVMSEQFIENKKYFYYKIPAFLIILNLIVLGYMETAFSRRKYKDLAKRTRQDAYIQKVSEYKEIARIITEMANKTGRKILVSLDPHLFNHVSNQDSKISLFWGPFQAWDAGYDLIITYKNNHPKEVISKISVNSAKYLNNLKALEGFRKHLNECITRPCYKEMKTPLNQLLILTKIE